MIKLFTGPMHCLGPQLVGLGKLNVAKQNLGLNPGRHCRCLDQAKLSLGGAIILGTVGGGEFLLDQKVITHCSKFTPEKFPSIIRSYYVYY